MDWVATEAALDRWARGELAGVEIYPAIWDVYGKGAGPERNARMAELSDRATGFHRGDGQRSRGTDDKARQCVRRGVTVHVYVRPWDWTRDPISREVTA